MSDSVPGGLGTTGTDDPVARTDSDLGRPGIGSDGDSGSHAAGQVKTTWQESLRSVGRTYRDLADRIDSSTFEDSVAEVYAELQQVLLSKHGDYGPQNIAASPGGPLNGLRVRAHDKLARINHLIDHGKQANYESLEDSFLDLANYCVIAALVMRGQWPS